MEIKAPDVIYEMKKDASNLSMLFLIIVAVKLQLEVVLEATKVFIRYVKRKTIVLGKIY